MRKFLVVVLVLFCATVLKTQTPEDNIFWVELFEKIYYNDSNNIIDSDNLIDDLRFIIQNPINVNNASRHDFEKLNFLTPIQINLIIDYIDQYGKLLSIYELYYIESLPSNIVDFLLYFLFVNYGEEKFNYKRSLNYSKHKLILRTTTLLQKKNGYTDSVGYLGDKYQHLIKYNFEAKKFIKAGFTIEKDSGEKYFDNGADFSSAYLEFSNLKYIDKLILGDYKLSFGQGLTVWQNMGGGKRAALTNLAKASTSISKYSSAGENEFFRGVAITTVFENIRISSFYSYRFRDASIDTSGFTLYNTGLHRTTNELSKVNNVKEKNYGSRVSLDKRLFRLGFNFIHTSFNNRFSHNSKVYKINRNNNTSKESYSFDYRAYLSHMQFFGEYALDYKFNSALISGLLIDAASEVKVVLLYRNYSDKYYSQYSNAFNESDSFNEEGFYLGLELSPFEDLKISTYYDSYKYPWLKYNTKGVSYGNDIFIRCDYLGLSHSNLYVQTKRETKYKSFNFLNTKNDFEYTKQNVRIDFRHKLYSKYLLSTRIELTSYQDYIEHSTGVMVYQDLKYTPEKSKLSFTSRYMFFDTPDFNTSIYAYEPDVLYAFSTPVVTGRGSKFVFVFKYKFSQELIFWMKFTHIDFFNKTTIGSGQETIDGNLKNEVKFQCLFKF